jgi:hypothetical protein
MALRAGRDECADQRVHGSVKRPTLRLEQRSDEEPVTAELEAASLAFYRTRRDLHRSIFEQMLELRI